MTKKTNLEIIIIVFFALIIVTFLIYNQVTHQITNLITGKVAITSNVLNEGKVISSLTINKINFFLILIILIILFFLVRCMNNKKSNHI